MTFYEEMLNISICYNNLDQNEKTFQKQPMLQIVFYY